MVGEAVNMDKAVEAIRKCQIRADLDKNLEPLGLTDIEKIDCLNKCMYNPITNFSEGDSLSDQDKLEITKQMFLAGAWRLKEIYDRMRVSAIA